MVKMGSGWKGVDIGDIDDLEDNEEEQANIREFVNSGELVVLVSDLETFNYELGLEDDEVEIYYLE